MSIICAGTHPSSCESKTFSSSQQLIQILPSCAQREGVTDGGVFIVRGGGGRRIWRGGGSAEEKSHNTISGSKGTGQGHTASCQGERDHRGATQTQTETSTWGFYCEYFYCWIVLVCAVSFMLGSVALYFPSSAALHAMTFLTCRNSLLINYYHHVPFPCMQVWL